MKSVTSCLNYYYSWFENQYSKCLLYKLSINIKITLTTKPNSH